MSQLNTVAIAFNAKGYARFKEFCPIELVGQGLGNDYDGLMSDCQVMEYADGGAVLYWPEVEWNSHGGYASAMIEEFCIDTMYVDAEQSEACRFLRIGENISDVTMFEAPGDGIPNFSVSRTIELSQDGVVDRPKPEPAKAVLGRYVAKFGV